jgi:hypothetical protein
VIPQDALVRRSNSRGGLVNVVWSTERDVHLALTQADFRRYGEQGKYVAVRVMSTRGQMVDGVGYADVHPLSS